MDNQELEPQYLQLIIRRVNCYDFFQYNTIIVSLSDGEVKFEGGDNSSIADTWLNGLLEDVQLQAKKETDRLQKEMPDCRIRVRCFEYPLTAKEFQEEIDWEHWGNWR